MTHPDPDPLYPSIGSEVRRRPPADRSGCVVPAVVLAVLVAIAIAGLVANANAAPSGTPKPGSWTVPFDASTFRGAPDEAVGETVVGDAAASRSRPAFGAPLAARYRGTATWYCGAGSPCTRGYRPGDLIAAIDRNDSVFRKGDRVTVRAFGRAVTVTIVDVCACGGVRVIDLSWAVFARLADPDLGVIPVTIELARSTPTAPTTDATP